MSENTTTPEKNEFEFTARQEVVAYSDNAAALIFANTGETVAWEGHKWVDPPAQRSANTMIVTTSSGNQYAIGEGLILNAKTGKALNVPGGVEVPSITIGEQWVIPGVMQTSAVESVGVLYGGGATPDRLIDHESPFAKAKDDLMLKRQQLIEERGMR